LLVSLLLSVVALDVLFFCFPTAVNLFHSPSVTIVDVCVSVHVSVLGEVA
jgi:hypothetical protein